MNELYLDSTSGKNLTSKRLDQGASSKKRLAHQSTGKESFQDILKSAVGKAESPPKIRQDKVDKYKSSLANGTYKVKAEELAEKMIQKIREDKTRKIM
jgi:anti-sigma28 factor (negative regulator of flagellin synthesis)